MNDKKKLLKTIFFSTLYLSAFTFGGGYVIVSLMKEKFVDKLKLINDEEMLDLIAIAQSSPGAVAINGAIVVGYKLCGILGVITAVIATIIPPFFILIVISMFYNAFRTNKIVSALLEGMQVGVGAIIAAVSLDMGGIIVKEKNILMMIIMIVAFCLNYIYNVNVVYIIIGCAIIGIIKNLIDRSKLLK